MLRLKIIVNCGPCAAFIEQCLRSITSQTYPHWEAYVTVDPCGDRTFERALVGQGDDARIVVTRNRTPLYSMANLVRAIERSQAQPEDVIVVLDGDDWFYTDQALQVIVNTYLRHDCWLTYGSWVPNVDDGYVGQWPPYRRGPRISAVTPIVPRRCAPGKNGCGTGWTTATSEPQMASISASRKIKRLCCPCWKSVARAGPNIFPRF